MLLADSSLSCGFGSVVLCLIGDGLLCPLLCQKGNAEYADMNLAMFAKIPLSVDRYVDDS
jgi:hypothetical protein